MDAILAPYLGPDRERVAVGVAVNWASNRYFPGGMARKPLKDLARPAGFEPTTSGLGILGIDSLTICNIKEIRRTI